MICPVELTHEVSDLSGGGQGCMAGCWHAANDTGRSEAGDETTGRNVTGNGEADHLVSGSGVFPYRQRQTQTAAIEL